MRGTSAIGGGGEATGEGGAIERQARVRVIADRARAVLLGDRGKDSISGGGLNDTILGGPGRDTIRGEWAGTSSTRDHRPWTPDRRPWTPSTQISTLRRPSLRLIRASGSLTPVLECTQVSAMTRVRGPSAPTREETISSAVVRAALR